MKLKKWLQEHKNMTYAEYKTLPELEQKMLQYDHKEFCRKEQIHARQNWRLMTAEEKKKMEEWAAKEIERYEISDKIGGLDERGNYTALHYRF